MAKKDGKKGKDEGAAAPAKGAASAANLPLFYTQPQPLDAKKHANYSLKKNFGFNFTKGDNAVPVNMIEMAQVCHSYPIAFSPDGNATPVAILGLRDNENLFLHDDGRWEEDAYIPAYIRRYPFIFSEMPGTDQLTLCIDMNDFVVDQKGGDQPFFTKDGKPSELAQHALDFCKNYHAAAQQTIEFSQALVQSGILVDREAQINVGGKRKINFSGFKIVDEKKFSELSDATVTEWRRKGWLPFIYAHLFSGAQWQRLSRLLSRKLDRDAA